MVMILEYTYKINFQNHIQPLQLPAIRMCISILTTCNTPVEMRLGNVQLDKTYCLYFIQFVLKGWCTKIGYSTMPSGSSLKYITLELQRGGGGVGFYFL